MSRQSALLWLALAFGSALPATAAEVLPGPVEEVKRRLGDGDVDAAIKAGESAVAALQQDSQAWFWLGRAYARQAMQAGLLSKPKWAGKTRDAYEKSDALDEDNLDARYDLMQYYLAAPAFLGGDRAQAEAQARQMARRDPVMGKLADAFLAQNDEHPVVAEKLLREALAIDPARERVRLSLAMLLQGGERWDDIGALWRDALARDADDALAHYQLGRLAVFSGADLPAGLAHIERFIALGKAPEGITLGAAHWRRGQLLEKLARREEAIAALEEAVRREPKLEQASADLERLRDG
jgi:tetratricopeptide (TPR) repeat protein